MLHLDACLVLASWAAVPQHEALRASGTEASGVATSCTAQEAYLKASNTDANDQFGFAVAVAGDTAVVGALGEDSGSGGINGDENDDFFAEAGAAYVFVRDGAGWAQELYLKADDPVRFSYFGQAVAISETEDRVVVGAPFEDREGAVYVFRLIASGWNQEARLEEPSVSPLGDRFGISVAISGDRLAVGHPGRSGGGEVQVYRRNVLQWVLEQRIQPSVFLDGGDDFGAGVDMEGDTLVIGVPFEDSAATGANGAPNNDDSAANAGAVYVYVRQGTTWVFQAYVKASNTQAQDRFGSAVALSGDTLVVGTPRGGCPAACSAGSAYVFTRNGSTWSEEALLTASNADVSDRFGSSVSLSGDTLVIGAHEEDGTATGVGGVHDNGATGAGAAYVFTRSGIRWTEQAYVKASNTFGFDAFGSSVAVSDGTVFVGAVGEDSNATGVNGDQGNDDLAAAGAVYVFDLGQAAVGFRNAGANPVSYAAGPIVIGSTFTATVDNNTAGQLTSILFAFDTAVDVTLGNGQRLLSLDLGGSGEAFTGAGLFPASSAGGVDTFSLPFANDPVTCGVVFYSQAIQFGNPPFVLSNAQDLTIGT